MKHMRYLLLSLTFSLSPCALMAQGIPQHPMYVDFGVTDTDDIVSMLDGWKPGDKFSHDADYVDENFFISRVPLKARFTHAATQANPRLDVSNGKNLCWCVPIGEMTSKWGPLPRWTFDADDFSMWQYINVHANWSNGWWRVPGAFNDVAHKNGVRTGCLYFINWGEEVNDSSSAGRMLAQLSARDADGHFKYARKLISFLRYYGIDGIGVNPEGTWSQQLTDDFTSFLAECHREAAKVDFPFHVEWYSVVTNTGALDDHDCTLETGVNDHWFEKEGEKVTDVFFLNYNWTEQSLKTSVASARELGRSTFDLYAGFDQEGQGYGSSYFNGGWEALMKYPVSIIVWGGHACSQLYADSHEDGYGALQVQNEYQKKQELLFTGGSRNPLNTPAVSTLQFTPTYSSLSEFHGYSKAVIEQSALTELPFVTRFSLGNGQWMKQQGQVTFDHGWYNIGMQDYLPTWRWWVDNGDGRTVGKDAIGVDLTFDDAWYGGSCLRLHGATGRSHIRLFSTLFGVESGTDEVSVTYKVKDGTDPHLQLCLSCVGTEDERRSVTLPPAAQGQQGWTTSTFHASDFGLTRGDTIACIGLEANGTQQNYETLIGEMSYIPAAFSETPATPVITYAQMLRREGDEADVKVVFDVPFSGTRRAAYADCPIYNEEVGAWYYEVYVRPEGGAPRLVATTTSWASYVVDVPLEGAESLQIGVRAVGRDGRTVSPLAWSRSLTHERKAEEGIVMDKSLVKPGETFTVGFKDPVHPAADFEVVRAQTGEVVVREQAVTSFSAALPEVGIYDVRVTTSDTSQTNRALVLVSPESTGRLPQVKELKADRQEVDVTDATVHLTADVDDGTSYMAEGKLKPCMVSKALHLADPYQFTVDSEVMDEYQHTSYALWFKADKFVHGPLGTVLMKKVNHNYPGSWTEKEWGQMWTAIRPAGYGSSMPHAPKVYNGADELSVSMNAPEAGTEGYDHEYDSDGMTEGYTLIPGRWYHCCVVQDGRHVKLYLNGRCVADATSRGTDPHDWVWASFYVGGQMTHLAGFTGWIDEVQVWSKALTADEVLQSMKGYDEAPDGLEGYFKFESSQTDGEGHTYIPNVGHASDLVPGGYLTYRVKTIYGSYDENHDTLDFGPGVPLLGGTLPVELKQADWNAEGADLVSTRATDATAVYTREGLFPVSLTLTNTWGSASAMLTDSIRVTVPAGISEGNAYDGVRILTDELGQKVRVAFPDAAPYGIVVYDNRGRMVARRTWHSTAGQCCEFSLHGSDGVYVVAIFSGTRCVATAKVVKRR